jgi:Transposase DDE domain
VTGAGFAQALVLGGLAHPEGTRKQLHHQATQAGLQVSLQGLDQRFSQKSVTFMRSLLEAGMSQMVQSESKGYILPQFNGVYITDCTRLVWATSGVKMAVRLELQQGQLEASLMDLKQNDQRAAVIEYPLPQGALHLNDLGLFKLKRLHDWSEQGIYWLVRYKAGICLSDLDGQRLDLKTLLSGNEALCQQVYIGSGQDKVLAELRAAPLSGEALTKRQARLKEQARLDQRPLSLRQQEVAGWTLYLTNIPDLTFAQAHILARTRWQIELLFKLWKSHGKVLVSRSADPIRQQCEGYAKLLGVLIAHWVLLVAGWQPQRLSALDALRILRSHIALFHQAFARPSRFLPFFHNLTYELAFASPHAKRRKNPLAFQLWRDFDLPPS